LLMNKQIGLKRYEVEGRKVLFYFDEIPSQCLTCVRFQAFREYIVGKTAPMPITVYDYYEPAFEATRFYNVSESSPLARELCDGPTCNEVESSASQGPVFLPPGLSLYPLSSWLITTDITLIITSTITPTIILTTDIATTICKGFTSWIWRLMEE
ncbi:C3 and PZP-like alpha-2-macroglobulin domain-containing protein 8, partial [Gracilinanus agilis]|uniref:C3 and PZP-like alpha-2-macroglobulin domain-containing protein 8 n=1 Tax=Gracilinanus agilis TaxID=191870 RepID=UPI001CFDB561